MKTISQDIRTGQFKKMYLLCGDEAFLKKSYKNQLKAAIIGGDTMNYHYFEGKGFDVDEIISLADTAPFFGERRLIQIEDSGLFKGGGSAADVLAEYLPQMPETTCLLFVESETDKRCRLYKAVRECGYVAEMNRQDEEQLAAWAGGILARAGRKITVRTMNRFLDKTGDDMENIRMELEKLIAYTEGRGVVTDEDVDAVCTEQITGRIFEMVTAIANRRTRQAMDLYEDLLTVKEPPLRILFLIARQFNQILQVKDMMEDGMGRDGIAAQMKLKPYVAGKIMAQARTFTREQILSYMEMCVDSEEAVKTGRLDDRIAVEMLIAKRV